MTAKHRHTIGHPLYWWVAEHRVLAMVQRGLADVRAGRVVGWDEWERMGEE